MKKHLTIIMVLLTSCASMQHGYKPLDQFADGNIYGRHDAFTNVTFYRHREFLPGAMKGVSPAEVYMVRTISGLKPRLRFSYAGPDWIFMQRAILINGNSSKIQYTFNDWDVKREVLPGGNVKETYETTFTNARAHELLQLFASGTPAIQLSGEKRAEFTFVNRHVRANIRMLQEYIKRIDG